MPRQPRIDIPGLLQHVIFRGVARSDIFLNDVDREDFVQQLGQLLDETGTRCYAWTLLDNHVLCGAPHKTCYVKRELM